MYLTYLSFSLLPCISQDVPIKKKMKKRSRARTQVNDACQPCFFRGSSSSGPESKRVRINEPIAMSNPILQRKRSMFVQLYIRRFKRFCFCYLALHGSIAGFVFIKHRRCFLQYTLSDKQKETLLIVLD
jgi:hypothetical protein